MAGAKIVVEVPLTALVVVALATKLVVLEGANQTLLVLSPEETIVIVAAPAVLVAEAKTVSWLVGAVLSTVKVEPEVGAEVIILLDKSVPVERETVVVPLPAATVWT